MRQVSIVGLGMSAGTLTVEGLSAVERADLLLGAPRLVAQFGAKPSVAGYTPEAVRQALNGYETGRFCVLVSGDTGFYSAAEKLCAALTDCEVTLVPGVSSLAYFFARLKLAWQDAAAVSCHGRGANLADTVRRNRLTFVLTGGNAAELGESLAQAGYGALCVHVGENLGMAEERVHTMPVSALPSAGIGKLAVLLVENPGGDSRVRFGIPDAEFTRGDVPMTKAEVRAVTLSKLALHPGAVCCDIGAGTGSVTVEMALAAYGGTVYALDKNAEAIRLVVENCRGFHIGNVKTIVGDAPEALADLPPFDAAFVGGCSGKIGAVFDAVLGKNPRARVVVNAVTLETLHAATQAFGAHGIEPEMMQLGVTRLKRTESLHMLQAQSPVFILSGGGHE